MADIAIQNRNKRRIIIAILIAVAVLFVVDFVYKTALGINPGNRSRCIFYTSAPRILFLAWESFFETAGLLLLSIWAGVFLEKRFFNKPGRLPRNPLAAFAVGALLPVCSCSALGFVPTFRDKIPLRSLIAFLTAAPVLNPYIIVLSFTELGWKYAVLRIAGCLVLSLGAGYLVELFSIRGKRSLERIETKPFLSCNTACAPGADGIVLETWKRFRSLLLIVLIACVLSFVFSLLSVDTARVLGEFGRTIWGRLGLVLVGIPLYLCHGSDVLVLRPFLENGILTVGMGAAFSFTSTAICISSIVLLARLLGKRITIVYTVWIFVFSFGVSWIG